MANAQMGPINERFVDRRRGRTQDGVALAEAANLTSLSALRTRLTAISGTTYTAAQLDKMSVNDMVYALRVHSADAAGI